MYSGKSCSYDSESSDDGTVTDPDYDSSSQSELGATTKKHISRGRWTKDEDDTLRRIIENYGSDDWKQIASFFPDRSEMQCYHRWQKALNPDLVKGPWTKEEDDRVTQLVLQYGPKRWSLICKFLNGRTGKQCRERWHNHLNPDIKKSAWTLDEDRIIYDAHKQLGNRWAEIAKRLPGRTDNAIKNHWNSTMKRKVETHNPYTPIKHHGVCAQDNRVAYILNADQSAIATDELASAPNVHKGQGLVQTLNPTQDAASTNQNAAINQWASPDRLSANGRSEENSMFWINSNDESLTPLRGMADFTDPSGLLDLDGSVPDLNDFDLMLNSQDSDSVIGHSLSHRGSTGYHFDSRAISELSKENYGSLIPITSPITSRFSTPPTILRKSRPKLSSQRSRRILDDSLSSTPKGTPIKTLPFSPSQFLNLDKPSPPMSGQQVRTSTPVINSHHATPKIFAGGTPVRYFRTPNNAKRSLLEFTPRTPTPLKDALAALEKRSGTNRFMPCTPGQLEDISEIIKQDFGSSSSGVKRMSSRGSLESPSKRVRKCLTQQLVLESDQNSSHFADDEQSHSLLSDCMLLSPPTSSVAKGMPTLNNAFLLPASPVKMSDGNHGRRQRKRSKHETPFKPPNTMLDKAWEKVACGRSEDQIFMTEQAKKILRSCRPRALNL